MNRIIAAAALTIALWGLKRWLDRRYVRIPPVPHGPTESWENEGGALVSPATAESTGAPR